MEGLPTAILAAAVSLLLGFLLARPLLIYTQHLLREVIDDAAWETTLGALVKSKLLVWLIRIALSLFAWALWWRYGVAAETLELFVLVCALVVLTITDLFSCYIPNAVVLLAAVARLVYVTGVSVSGGLGLSLLVSAFRDALLVAAPLLLLVILMDRLLGRPSMGGGDLKLFALAGLYVGWQKSLMLIVLASLMGIVFSLVWGRYTTAQQNVHKRYRIKAAADFPFGPSIALAFVLIILCA